MKQLSPPRRTSSYISTFDQERLNHASRGSHLPRQLLSTSDHHSSELQTAIRPAQRCSQYQTKGGRVLPEREGLKLKDIIAHHQTRLGIASTLDEMVSKVEQRQR